ncbi:MAG: DUF2835 domain-containing protein [Nitrospirota bacterium]|nr:DUF2835 domain-containing protein [Nitrospirota bacterium]
MRLIRVNLHISSRQYLAYYKGTADAVVATSVDGRKVRFPARVLRQFLTHDGIDGTFLIRFSEHNKFLGIQKVK